MAAIVCMKWLFWPVSLAVMSRIGCYLLCEGAGLARVAAGMSRIGRYLLYEVAALDRIAYVPYWPLGCSLRWRVWPVSVDTISGQYRWPL